MVFVPRSATVMAYPDLTGFAPQSERFTAYDSNTYDGAPDAGPQIVGHGATSEEALADYDRLIANRDRA
jgi:hypothetical protein